MNRKSYITVFLFVIFSISVFSQQAIVPVGGDISNANGSVSFTIGQAFYATNFNADNSVSEGIQQPHEISFLSIDDHELNITMYVYPIPTSDVLTIKVSDYNAEELTYEVIDLQGKVILTNKIINPETSLNLSRFNEAIYVLNIKNSGRIIRTTKIIKH